MRFRRDTVLADKPLASDPTNTSRAALISPLETPSGTARVTQAPENGQNYNRYTYAFNNPLRFTDPSGYVMEEITVTASASSGGTFINNGGATANYTILTPFFQATVLPGLIAQVEADYEEWLEEQKEKDTKSPIKSKGDKSDSNGEVIGATPAAQKGAKVVDSTAEAFDHYFNGNGEPVEPGPKTKHALRNHPLVQRQSEALRRGTAKHLNDNLSVEMRDGIYHIGKTRVDFSTACQSGSCTTTYTGFSNDGFWDPIAPAGFGDGIGGDWEIYGGTGYHYSTYTWSETYMDNF